MTISLALVILTFSSFTEAAKVLIDTFKDRCPGYNGFSYINFNETKFVLLNHTTLISANTIVLKSMDHGIKFEIFPVKCNSKDALDTCETYRSYKIRNVCSLLHSEKTPWAPFLASFNPRVACPFKKGIYVLQNGTLEASYLPMWAKSYWKVMTVIRDQVTNDFIFCNYMEFQVV